MIAVGDIAGGVVDVQGGSSRSKAICRRILRSANSRTKTGRVEELQSCGLLKTGLVVVG